jgi:hypothetical protein
VACSFTQVLAAVFSEPSLDGASLHTAMRVSSNVAGGVARVSPVLFQGFLQSGS